MKLNHLDKNDKPTMVDVTEKKITTRIAIAKSTIFLPSIITDQINDGGDLNLKKGSVFNTAIIAGTMAVKNTSQLIPFCHPLQIESIKIDISPIDKNHFEVTCSVKITGKTGVEMEALTGASITALTIYDMCKALSHEIRIEQTYLYQKSGGKRDINQGKICD